MAMAKTAVALLIATTLTLSWLQEAEAGVYKVGDSAGWTIIGNVDYKQWAASKTFQVDDIILFEYNSEFHNVMCVTHPMYKSCNASAPLATYTTGNDSIPITTRGHHYFLCSVPGHCQAGQKVDINVLPTSEIAQTPAAASPVSSPSVPSAMSPGPSPNNAMPLSSLKYTFQSLALGIIVLANLIMLPV